MVKEQGKAGLSGSGTSPSPREGEKKEKLPRGMPDFPAISGSFSKTSGNPQTKGQPSEESSVSQGAICLSILDTVNHWPREAHRKHRPGVNGVVDFKAQKLEASFNCTS